MSYVFRPCKPAALLAHERLLGTLPTRTHIREDYHEERGDHWGRESTELLHAKILSMWGKLKPDGTRFLQQDIADILNCSRMTVSKHLRKAGITRFTKPRPRR